MIQKKGPAFQRALALLKEGEARVARGEGGVGSDIKMHLQEIPGLGGEEFSLVYRTLNEIEGRDPNRFKVLGEPPPPSKQEQAAFARMSAAFTFGSSIPRGSDLSNSIKGLGPGPIELLRVDSLALGRFTRDAHFALAHSSQPAEVLRELREFVVAWNGPAGSIDSWVKTFEATGAARAALDSLRPMTRTSAISEREVVFFALRRAIENGSLDANELEPLRNVAQKLFQASDRPMADLEWIRSTLEPLYASDGAKPSLFGALDALAQARQAQLDALGKR